LVHLSCILHFGANFSSSFGAFIIIHFCAFFFNLLIWCFFHHFFFIFSSTFVPFFQYTLVHLPPTLVPFF
jgi:hypothetical protein